MSECPLMCSVTINDMAHEFYGCRGRVIQASHSGPINIKDPVWWIELDASGDKVEASESQFEVQPR